MECPWKNRKMILRPLTPEDRTEAVQAHTELALDNFDFLLDSFGKYEENGDWPAYLDRLDLNRRGEDVPVGRVPSTFLVAEVDGRIIGRVSIRHELNAYLEERGGHIGYGIRPEYRGRGYATEILSMALLIMQDLGVQKVLVTCNDSNAVSGHVIEKCGGVLENIIEADDGERVRRYWFVPASV
jgi:predicted acetyltransferase